MTHNDRCDTMRVVGMILMIRQSENPLNNQSSLAFTSLTFDLSVILLLPPLL